MGRALLTASLVLWAAALAIGSVDGLYFHLWKFRIYRRPEARLEHLAHAGRALLVIPTLWAAFFPSVPQRIPLILALIAGDWAIAIWDVFLERKSRVWAGGMPHFEYFIHVAATAFHSSAEAVTVTAWLVGGWPGGQPPFPVLVLLPMLALAIGASLAHFVLMHPRFSTGEK